MVAYLCTYLFPAGERIHLNDFVDRDDPAPRAWYTLPSVPGKASSLNLSTCTHGVAGRRVPSDAMPIKSD
jgi:hypothetical protein